MYTREMVFQKILGVLVSRKFWASVISILVVVGLVPESREPGLVEAVATIIVGVTYILSTAIEDGLARK